LHEIYGINDFIHDIGEQYHFEGYDVFCPDFFQTGVSFSYSDSEEAYREFMNIVGFEAYMKVNKLVDELKLTYETVVIIGFSVGATLAWRCSENESCDGTICCYGSRIRDYLMVNPQCPVFLSFAKQDSFDVAAVVAHLKEKEQVKIEIMEAKHGFIDMFSENYSASQAQAFNLHRVKFLDDLKK
jgi:dienelactone hydrolase